MNLSEEIKQLCPLSYSSETFFYGEENAANRMLFQRWVRDELRKVDAPFAEALVPTVEPSSSAEDQDRRENWKKRTEKRLRDIAGIDVDQFPTQSPYNAIVEWFLDFAYPDIGWWNNSKILRISPSAFMGVFRPLRNHILSKKHGYNQPFLVTIAETMRLVRSLEDLFQLPRQTYMFDRIL